MSRPSRESIRRVLAERYEKVAITLVDNMSDLLQLVKRKPDLVFLGMKFINAPNTNNPNSATRLWISDYLDSHGIAYTGSSGAAVEMECIKSYGKQQVIEAGLTTSPYLVISKNDVELANTATIPFPLFVKPTDLGGGTGIDSSSIVHNKQQLATKLANITQKHDSDALIEKYLSGREFSVSVLKKEDEAGYDVMPIELIANADENGARILTNAIKEQDSEYSTVSIDAVTRQKVCDLAIDVFQALQARDYGRIDVRLDGEGTPQFLEANLVPSLKNSPGNYFPKACAGHIGLDYQAMILQLARLGLQRVKAEDAIGVEASYSGPVQFALNHN